MKLLVFSDPHLTGRGDLVVGQQSDARFAACLSQALERHGDAAHILVAGDLCEEPGAYPLLAEHLVATGLPVTCLMGNVDDRAAFAAAMPGVTPGFQQATLSFGRHRVITLDTLDEDASAAPSGVLCDARLSDLEARLKAAEGQIITLVMHHPPAPFGMPFFDPIGLRNGAEVLRLASEAGVTLILCGHVHRSVTTVASGLPIVSLRSTAFALSPADTARGVAPDPDAPPGYAVLMLGEDGPVLHAETCSGL